MVLFSRTIESGHICFQSESRVAADMFAKLYLKVFGEEISGSCRETTRKSGTVLYSFDIEGESAGRVLSAYRITPGERSINSDIIPSSSLGVFAGGAFLACGSVNDPSKEYHLEFVVPDEKLAGELAMLLGDFGANAKTVVRRGQYVVYIKESESIEDTLTFIGATQCTLELMNVKIFKDVRNKANRLANCDSANIDKVVNAAMRQIEDIILINNTMGLDSLPDELREIAELRLSNSGMSLQEIGDSLQTPISRSGVNHRFRRIAKIAEKIRSGGEN